MPSRIVVFGGTTASDVSTQLSCVNIGSTDRDVVVLENARRYWPIVRISIRRCQQVLSAYGRRNLRLLFFVYVTGSAVVLELEAAAP